MFSFHSLYPAKLYQKSASEPKVESTTAGGTISHLGRSGSTLSRIEDLELRLIEEASTHHHKRKAAEKHGSQRGDETPAPGGRTGNKSSQAVVAAAAAIQQQPLRKVASESSLADVTAASQGQAKRRKSPPIMATEQPPPPPSSFMAQESQTELDDRPTSRDLSFTPLVEDEALSLNLDGAADERDLARFQIAEQADYENEDFDDCEDQAYLGDLSTFSSKTGSVTRTNTSEAYGEPEMRQDFARSASVVDVVAISEDGDGSSPPPPEPRPTEREEPFEESTGAPSVHESTIPQIETAEAVPEPCQKTSSHTTIPQIEPTEPKEPFEASKGTTLAQKSPIPQIERPDVGPEPCQKPPSHSPTTLETSKLQPTVHSNFIPYRRDPETVVAYLIPLPRPAVRGVPVDSVPSRYFLYTPPPPHLLQPTAAHRHHHHHTESHVHKVRRHWQQHLRAATSDAHRPACTAQGLRSRLAQRTARCLDDGGHKSASTAFITRVHPDTVRHLILIHPLGLVGSPQTLPGVLQTIHAQVLEAKHAVQRQSVLRAAVLLPALAVDAAAVCFGGRAEGEGGIWMQSSIAQYRGARALARKMAPVPKETEITRDQLVRDAARVAQQEPNRPGEPGGQGPRRLRRSLDALRKGMMGSVRESRSQRRAKGKAIQRHQGLESGPHETPKKKGQAASTASSPVDSLASIVVDSDFCGFLEHAVEDIASAGSLVEEGDNHVMQTTLDGQQSSRKQQGQPVEKLQAKGENFQLTLCSSPGMDLFSKYVQASCHQRDSKAFSKPHTAPTEEDVLAMLGWEPQERGEPNSPSQADDLQWQKREAETDLRSLAHQAAKSWQKQCNRHIGKRNRSVIRKPSKTGTFPAQHQACTTEKRPRSNESKAQKKSDRQADPKIKRHHKLGAIIRRLTSKS